VKKGSECFKSRLPHALHRETHNRLLIGKTKEIYAN